MRYCPECGAKIEEIRKFCPECGFKFSNQTKLEDTTLTKTNYERWYKEDNIKQENKMQPSQNIKEISKKSKPKGFGIILIIIAIVIFIFGLVASFTTQYVGEVNGMPMLGQPWLPLGVILIIIAIVLFIYGVYRITKK